MRFGADPLVVMDSRWWPAIAEVLIASGVPWPEDAILADLRWWQDQERVGRAKRPCRSALERRWRVGNTVARRLLKAEDRWGLERRKKRLKVSGVAARRLAGVGERDGPATNRQPTSNQPATNHVQVEPVESSTVNQTPTNDQPTGNPTRVGTFKQSTVEQSIEQQPALLLVPDPPAPEVKPKRKGKTPKRPPLDSSPEAITRCLDAWFVVSGQRQGLRPGEGLHKAVGDALASGLNVELRLAYLVSLNGTGTAGWAKSNGVKLSAFLRAKSKLTDPLDAEAEEWDAAGRPVALTPMPARASPKKAAGFWQAFDEEQGGGEVFDGQ